MEQARIDGVALAHEVTGSGEPLLLISIGPIADSFLPFVSERALADRHSLIRYEQRRMDVAADAPAPVSFAQHAADAAALLRHLGVDRAHVAGHSSGACIALQLAVDHPQLVHTLALLEPPLLGVPSGPAFLEQAGPAVAEYAAGHRAEAMATFLSMVCSLDWERCRTLVETRVPGAVARAIANADDFFGSYLPALGAWRFGAREAAGIARPVLSVVGSDTERLFAESHDLLRSWFPQLEACEIPGTTHLLHLHHPEPVARCVAAFLARHPMAAGDRGLRATLTPPRAALPRSPAPLP